VLLIGMMGSGKSSLGRRLAARTGWPFLDNDALVQMATGRTARDLLAAEGEEAMRAVESAALDAGLRVEPPTIIAVAAGVVLDEVARERLGKAGVVVWLHAPPEVLAKRATGATHRPWVDNDPRAWFERVTAEREPTYRSLADVTIDTSAGSPAASADAVLAALQERGSA
jgi:shikimate kinase